MTVHEADIERMKRGPHDLEERIDQLEKQKELLKSHCKKAGDTIKKLEDQISRLKGDIDRLVEENNNIKIIKESNK